MGAGWSGAVLVILVGLAGCEQLPGTPQNLAVKAVRAVMLDPAAARVAILNTSGDAVCGTVNGKNAMGAYVGARPFVARSGMVMVYSDPPSMDDIRRLRWAEKGAVRDDLVMRIEQDCAMPKIWRDACAIPFPAQEGDPHLCALWAAGDAGKLFDEVER